MNRKIFKNILKENIYNLKEKKFVYVKVKCFIIFYLNL